MDLEPEEKFLKAFEDVWAGTDAILGNRIREKDALKRPIALRHPFVFYLGHLPAFSWNLLVHHCDVGKTMHSEWDSLFSQGIDPHLGRTMDLVDEAPDCWPAWIHVLEYRDRIRRSIRELASSHKIPGCAVRLIVEHEAMHHETLYYMLAQKAEDQPPRPPPNQADFISMNQNTWVHVPKGTVTLGVGSPPETTSFGNFKWDNEYGKISIPVHAFSVSRFPVTVSQFANFIAANGYTTQKFWDREDWAWVLTENRQCPSSWRACLCEDKSNEHRDTESCEALTLKWHILTIDGPVEAENVADWPVSTSLAEARAYARWAGARLLKEEEWMRVAYDEKGISAFENRGNFDSIMHHPRSVYAGEESWCGACDVIGNGWEMTNSVFSPFPSFKPMKEYENYSTDSFGGDHFVLKGASWATNACLVRPSFRNYYRVRYPYVFSKFRLCVPYKQDM